MLCVSCPALAPALAVVAALLAGPAFGDPASAVSVAAWADPAAGSLTPPEPSPRTQAGPAPLEEAEMSRISGGQEVLVEVTAVQTLTGSSSGNSITAQSYASGDVTFSAEALSGFTGIGNFVVNTGANNTLQGSINVSIVTVPAP